MRNAYMNHSPYYVEMQYQEITQGSQSVLIIDLRTTLKTLNIFK